MKHAMSSQSAVNCSGESMHELNLTNPVHHFGSATIPLVANQRTCVPGRTIGCGSLRQEQQHDLQGTNHKKMAERGRTLERGGVRSQGARSHQGRAFRSGQRTNKQGRLAGSWCCFLPLPCRLFHRGFCLVGNHQDVRMRSRELIYH